jgi:hypothetical protein
MRDSSAWARRKSKGLLSGFWGLPFLFFVTLILSGCDGNVFEGFSDDSSFEARVEEARIDLDDEDYTGARDKLVALNEDHPNNAEVLRLLASAYSGLAGLDTFNLLEVIDQLDKQNNEGDIDTVGLVLGSSNGVLTAAAVQSKLANLQLSISALESISSRTVDERVQLGLVSLNHAALTIADMILENTGRSEITLTEAGLDALYTGTPDFSTEATSERLTSLSNDIANIDDAVDGIISITSADESNDLSESADQFQQDIDQNEDKSISQQELENYIANL